MARTCIEPQSSSSQAHTHPCSEGNWSNIVRMVMSQTSEPFIWHLSSLITQTHEGAEQDFPCEQGLVQVLSNVLAALIVSPVMAVIFIIIFRYTQTKP